jgi:ATP-dependent RNA helicase RhlE
VNFDSFNLAPQIAAGVKALGYTEPTPIQEKCIPLIMQGKDVMGLAQTGTGKTAAFALPILQRLLSGSRGRVRALVVCPTRELAEQTHDTFDALGKETGLRSCTIYGGVDFNPQIRKLKAGAEIVVACPGRLLDHMGEGNINLLRLEILVLDEADRMFDMGFLPDIRRIVKAIPANRQTLLFSATMPADISRLTQEVLRNPVIITIKHTQPLDTVTHTLFPVASHLKGRLLETLLGQCNGSPVLVFTRTKHRADRVAEQLTRRGFAAACIQGDLSQRQRQAALDGFKDGRYKVLVATDIAARGIDVEGISHVINYDLPDTADNYVHRTGRTGRAERTGDAFTLVTHEDEEMVRDIERMMNKRLERKVIDGFNYAAPAPERPAGPPQRGGRSQGRPQGRSFARSR